MESYHAPIFYTLYFDKAFTFSRRDTKQRLDLSKANWNKFRENFNTIGSEIKSLRVDRNFEENVKLFSMVTKEAANSAIHKISYFQTKPYYRGTIKSFYKRLN